MSKLTYTQKLKASKLILDAMEALTEESRDVKVSYVNGKDYLIRVLIYSDGSRSYYIKEDSILGDTISIDESKPMKTTFTLFDNPILSRNLIRFKVNIYDFKLVEQEVENIEVEFEEVVE